MLNSYIRNNFYTITYDEYGEQLSIVSKIKGIYNYLDVYPDVNLSEFLLNDTSYGIFLISAYLGNINLMKRVFNEAHHPMMDLPRTMKYILCCIKHCINEKHIAIIEYMIEIYKNEHTLTESGIYLLQTPLTRQKIIIVDESLLISKILSVNAFIYMKNHLNQYLGFDATFLG